MALNKYDQSYTPSKDLHRSQVYLYLIVHRIERPVHRPHTNIVLPLFYGRPTNICLFCDQH